MQLSVEHGVERLGEREQVQVLHLAGRRGLGGGARARSSAVESTPCSVVVVP